MNRIATYLVAATLGIALIASTPAVAQVGFGIDIGGYPAYPTYYSRSYGYPYGYVSTRYAYPYRGYSYPYSYGAWNYPYYNWGTPAAGLASIVAAPFEVAGAAAAAPVEVAGAAVTAPFAVAANATAPVVTGRSVAVEQPYYARRAYWTHHARYMRPGIVTGRSVAVEQPYYGRRMASSIRTAHHMRHTGYGRSAYVQKKY
jgi:hypothetical protein